MLLSNQLSKKRCWEQLGSRARLYSNVWSGHISIGIGREKLSLESVISIEIFIFNHISIYYHSTVRFPLCYSRRRKTCGRVRVAGSWDGKLKRLVNEAPQDF